MKRLITLLLSLACFVVDGSGADKVREISHQELNTAISAKQVTLLDVNGTDSFTEGRLPGAIDYIANKDKIAALLPRDKNALVVAYCGNEYCSAYQAAATAARELGYTNVKHYAPGIDGWRKSGAKIEKS